MTDGRNARPPPAPPASSASPAGSEEQEFDLFEDSMRDVIPLTSGITKPDMGESETANPVGSNAAPQKSAPGSPKRHRLIPAAKFAASKPIIPDSGLARPTDLAAYKDGRYPGLDGRTARRLKRGEIKVEEHLDLHGMNRDEAETALAGFITTRRRAGLRCVLIITGKGDRPPARNARSVGTVGSARNAGTVGNARPAGSAGSAGPTWTVGSEDVRVLRRLAPQWLSCQPISDHVITFAVAQQRDGGEGALYVLLKKFRT